MLEFAYLKLEQTSHGLSLVAGDDDDLHDNIFGTQLQYMTRFTHTVA